jgi:hypothetical protein
LHVKLPPRGGVRMTAEIAILNKTGVALAADSKVTIGGGKTFDTANKIFSLSKFHPVGIMIFGNAEFMGYPWETIVKIYRNSKRDRGEDSIAAWGENFIKFVGTFGTINDSDRKDNFELIVQSWFAQITQIVLNEMNENNEPLTNEVYNSAILRHLNRQIRKFEREDKIFADEFVATLKTKYSEAAKNIIDITFEPDNVREVATSFVWLAIARKAVFSEF